MKPNNNDSTQQIKLDKEKAAQEKAIQDKADQEQVDQILKNIFLKYGYAFACFATLFFGFPLIWLFVHTNVPLWIKIVGIIGVILFVYVQNITILFLATALKHHIKPIKKDKKQKSDQVIDLDKK